MSIAYRDVYYQTRSRPIADFVLRALWVNLEAVFPEYGMLLSIILIAFIAFGGLALTYLFAEDEPFLWRISAGTVAGFAIFGTAGFVIASFFGLNATTVLISLAVSFSPVFLLRTENLRARFRHEWQRAKGKLQGGNLKKVVRVLYYVLFFALFVFFFEQTMFETSQGIFTGGSQNLGDLPFHLGAIFGFTDGNNFPPQNPSFAGARFSYPFIADFITASFMKLGVSVKDAMLAQNVAWAFSLFVILERFVFKLVNDRLAAKIAPALLFFSGGLGFLWFFADYAAQGKSFVDFLWLLPKDYTISQDFRWGNSLVTLFLTQRSLLLGMPLTLVVLGRLWELFATENTEKYREEIDSDKPEKKIVSTFHFPFSAFVIGLIAGLLPLIHLHSLAVLFVAGVFLIVLKPDRWREWLTFAAGVAVIAIPELVWSLSGSATETSKFFAWHFGWDMPSESGLSDWNKIQNSYYEILIALAALLFRWAVFWIKNTGILIPMIAAGIYLIYSTRRGADDESSDTETRRPRDAAKHRQHEKNIPASPRHSLALIQFYLPFAFLFLIANAAKLAPWDWDNIKVLIYWYVGSIPFVALALAWVWRKATAFRLVAAVCFIVLIFSGSLDVWRTVSGQIKTRVFDADAVAIAERIKQRTPPNALFLNAPTYNSAVVLSGRQSLMRYPGHLSSHGIDYAAREADVKSIYSGGAAADELLRKYAIDYVLISPEERNLVAANEAFFRKYSLILEAGQYKVYKVRN